MRQMQEKWIDYAMRSYRRQLKAPEDRAESEREEREIYESLLELQEAIDELNQMGC